MRPHEAQPVRGGEAASAEWRAYAALIRMAFQLQLAYRFANVSGLLTNGFFGLLRAYVLIALFGARHAGRVAGYSIGDAITYTGLTQARIVERDGLRVTYRFTRGAVTASTLIGRLSARYRLLDLSVREPEIEDTVRRIYEERLLDRPVMTGNTGTEGTEGT
ncbi:MAG: ABC transporter permease [Anaerolineales bacterium]|nr:ABC transporter permease [Anaerolineales bacterium]